MDKPSEREKLVMSGPPFLLTPSEIDSLRQEMQAAHEWMRQELRRRRLAKEVIQE